MGIRGILEERGVFSFTFPVGFEEPMEKRVLRPELPLYPERFDVPVPDDFPSPRAADCAREKPPEINRKGVIQPEDCLSARPDEFARRAVVPVCDPGGRAEHLRDARQENFVRRLFPALVPVKGVQLDVDDVQAARERRGEGRLSASCGADDDNLSERKRSFGWIFSFQNSFVRARAVHVQDSLTFATTAANAFGSRTAISASILRLI